MILCKAGDAGIRLDLRRSTSGGGVSCLGVSPNTELGNRLEHRSIWAELWRPLVLNLADALVAHAPTCVAQRALRHMQ
jgi:hypothetical protein